MSILENNGSGSGSGSGSTIAIGSGSSITGSGSSITGSGTGVGSENYKAYFNLDSEPKTLSAHEHRPAYSSDGDYYSNPNAEDVFETIYGMMNESDPTTYPRIY